MEKKLQNPGVVFALALLCCALWGSAFPCVKIGYEWLAIEGAGSQILFAGYRFFLAGIFTFLIGARFQKKLSFLEKMRYNKKTNFTKLFKLSQFRQRSPRD